jgi:hypothetical protein
VAFTTVAITLRICGLGGAVASASLDSKGFIVILGSACVLDFDIEFIQSTVEGTLEKIF